MDCPDKFMKIFKYYKSNKPQPSLENVIALEKENYDSTKVVRNNVTVFKIDHQNMKVLGLENPKTWNIYSFSNHPGLIFIRNPFTTLGQRYWIRQCLAEYTKKPNKLNIDNEILIQDWWKECMKDNSKLNKKLRWTTLGYHHNWDTKVYSEENKSEFPNDLAELCEVMAKALGFDDFRAEAAIVNYYHIGSTLSAHTDHSELNVDAPLFSFSFGQSAIFLIGGKDKSMEPSPLLLNSGDVVVMSKEARLCYHAVPRIITSFTQPWNDNVQNKEPPSKIPKTEESETDDDWEQFAKYVEDSRINMNVRQVLNKNQKSLNYVV